MQQKFFVWLILRLVETCLAVFKHSHTTYTVQVLHHACFHFWSNKNVSSELHSACHLKGFFFKINLPSLYIAHDYSHVRVEEEVVKY